MRWFPLILARLQSTRMLAVSWTTRHDHVASLLAPASVPSTDTAQPMFPMVGMNDTGTVVADAPVCSSDGRLQGRTRLGGALPWAYGDVDGPPCVKSSVKSNTHAMADADAMGKAVTRPTMRVVPVKDLGQRDNNPLDRVRDGS
jgi:hypothetical protein